MVQGGREPAGATTHNTGQLKDYRVTHRKVTQIFENIRDIFISPKLPKSLKEFSKFWSRARGLGLCPKFQQFCYIYSRIIFLQNTANIPWNIPGILLFPSPQNHQIGAKISRYRFRKNGKNIVVTETRSQHRMAKIWLRQWWLHSVVFTKGVGCVGAHILIAAS